MGSIIDVLEDSSGIKCMDNLYTSVEDLDQKWFRSKEKCGLLDPCIARDHNCETQPIRYITSISRDRYLINPRGSYNFAVEPSVFLVPDYLALKALSAASSFLLLKELEVPFSQTEVQYVSVGNKEALSLLKAALTSPSSALTIGLGPFLKKQKPA
ncbi:unnamed protein product [Cuscuta epithymum]|nr:unnamed protein product [Cuscuta epithymum]